MNAQKEELEEENVDKDFIKLEAVSLIPILSLLEQKSEKGLSKIAEQVLISLQVVLEFMDKGVKGLLTGDLSVFLIQ